MLEQKELVEQVEDLLADWPRATASQILDALFADAVERQQASPFWGKSREAADRYAAAPELLRRLVEEVKRLRKRIKTMERDALEDARDAAAEARWQERQGEDYGSY